MLAKESLQFNDCSIVSDRRAPIPQFGGRKRTRQRPRSIACSNKSLQLSNQAALNLCSAPSPREQELTGGIRSCVGLVHPVRHLIVRSRGGGRKPPNQSSTAHCRCLLRPGYGLTASNMLPVLCLSMGNPKQGGPFDPRLQDQFQ